jgi:hypothetical protein
MHRRSLLRAQLNEAWRASVSEGYLNGLINSERALQVHFCLNLLRSTEKRSASRTILVEPQVRLGDGSLRFPDLLICTRRSVIGVVEFKFVPRARPSARKDLQTLEAMAQGGGQIEVQLSRYRGPKQRNTTFVLAESAVLCWAGLYAGAAVTLDARLTQSIGPRFMRMDALTREDEAPRVLAGRERPSAA